MTNVRGHRPPKPLEPRRPSGPGLHGGDRSITHTHARPDKERIARAIARAGLCSRREAERWITEGRVALNGKILATPAVTVTPEDDVRVDGKPLPEAQGTRLWLYHKPRGLVTTNHDPEGRATVFQRLPDDLPRVMSIGRLDINTEGLLLLTNDGGLARVLELPRTGWLRRYRVRVHGKVDQKELDRLKDGLVVDGIQYGPVEVTIERTQNANMWLNVALREGKNREVKNLLGHLGLQVTRLIRTSFGPFGLGDLTEGEVKEVRRRVLREQLGRRLADEAGLSEFTGAEAAPATPAKDDRPKKPKRSGAPARSQGKADKSSGKTPGRPSPSHSKGRQGGRGADRRRST